jgi:cytochrome P450
MTRSSGFGRNETRIGMNFLASEVRRDPFPLYAQARSVSPMLHDPASGLWMVFDYDGVRRVLSEHETFSSRLGPAEWMIFMDPPRQQRLRALIAKAFTPRSVAGLEGRIRAISRELLDAAVARAGGGGGGGGGVMELAGEYSVPLPMRVIAEMLGVPASDRPRFAAWTDAILNMSYTIPGDTRAQAEGGAAMEAFLAATAEMGEYVAGVLQERRASPGDDLLSRLAAAEVDGERLSATEILGFFQLLLVAGQETTTNLINNAILCFVEHPAELARVRRGLESLPADRRATQASPLHAAIEEVLRHRSPVQWMFRYTTRAVELHGQTIPERKVVLAMIGSANRDERVFADAARFDVARDPNPHLAFGHGVHFCLGAALARLEARIALVDLLDRWAHFELASSEPWEPRKALHVHGPTRLAVRYRTS